MRERASSITLRRQQVRFNERLLAFARY